MAISPLAAEARAIAAEFDFGTERVRKAVKHFVRQFGDGLAKDGDTMIPSYVTALPVGSEKGICLAVDIGGTNLRVCSVELHGDRTFTIKQNKTTIPHNIRVESTAQDLFGFLAEQVEIFLRDNYGSSVQNARSLPKSDHLPLGFTFSFTFNQTAINRGTLIRWDKGFDVPGVVGKDVILLLQDEINERSLPVRVTALANDTVGTLMTRSYTSPGGHKCILGAVFGTGTNGAYVEKASNFERLGSKKSPSGEMMVNTEWCSVDDELVVLLKNSYDDAVDKTSTNPGYTMFEKQVSGYYLGELFRLALLDLLDRTNRQGSLATLQSNSVLLQVSGIETSTLSTIEGDLDPALGATRQCLHEQLGVLHATTELAEAVKIIVHAIGLRAARLSGVAIAAVILKSECLAQAESHFDIGVEGSLVEYYPGFEQHIRGVLREIPEIGHQGEERIHMGLAKDGSGVGAALIAMVADKEKEARKYERMVSSEFGSVKGRDTAQMIDFPIKGALPDPASIANAYTQIPVAAASSS
ncbi:hexokinase-domain-containing protein [Phyllosticta citriasiana]|uniref:Phosphotransferase n=1 Tax=Phyllosticta citriasiana TaxID=595635 RepID=A0ABR1KGD6_9PEZI